MVPFSSEVTEYGAGFPFVQLVAGVYGRRVKHSLVGSNRAVAKMKKQGPRINRWLHFFFLEIGRASTFIVSSQPLLEWNALHCFSSFLTKGFLGWASMDGGSELRRVKDGFRVSNAGTRFVYCICGWVALGGARSISRPYRLDRGDCNPSRTSPTNTSNAPTLIRKAVKNLWCAQCAEELVGLCSMRGASKDSMES